jgi:hypothetical protein
VLATESNIALPESDVNREWFAQQHLNALASGQDPWKDSHTPNEQLLKVARTATQNREQSRIKLSAQGTKRLRRYSKLLLFVFRNTYIFIFLL